jgi:hypothetical protein
MHTFWNILSTDRHCDNIQVSNDEIFETAGISAVRKP